MFGETGIETRADLSIEFTNGTTASIALCHQKV